MRAQGALALLLALTAGFVDAAAYLVLHGLFTAHMTGNTTELAVRLARGDLSAGVAPAIAIGAFVLGVALSSAVCEVAARRGIASSAAPAFALEAALVAGFMAYASLEVNAAGVERGRIAFYGLILLAVLAMGAQAGAFTKIAGSTVRTTYISGMLTRLGQETANAVLARGRRSYLRGEVGLDGRARSAGRAAFLASIWLAFFAGGISGAFAEPRLLAWAFAFPLGALAVATAFDLVRPVHEHEEA